MKKAFDSQLLHPEKFIDAHRMDAGPDCSELQSTLALLNDYLGRARAGDSLPLGSSAASEENRARDEWSKEKDDLYNLKNQDAQLAVQFGDFQVMFNYLAGALAITGIIYGAAGAAAAPPTAGTSITVGGLALLGYEAEAAISWVIGDYCQYVGDRYQEVSNALGVALEQQGR
jgi:hypothetical protein